MRRAILTVLLLAVGLPMVTADSASGAPIVLPDGFTSSTLIDGLSAPTNLAFAGDGTVFITEKRGKVLMLSDIDDNTTSTVLDIRTEVHNTADRGLLGLAVDPNYPATPHVYISYTLDKLPSGGGIPAYGNGTDWDSCPNADSVGCPALSRLSRVTINNGVGTETVLFEGHCQQFRTHAVGDILFDNSGNLLASFGDGSTGSFTEYGQRGNPCGDPDGPVGTNLSAPGTEGGQARSQDILTRSDPTGIHGSVVRVNKSNFNGIGSNPLGGDAEAMARRIRATGFRNPFRMAMDPANGRLYVGNVGGAGREEIQLVEGSGMTNGGWPCYEGNGTTQNTFWLTTDICDTLIASGDHDQPLFLYTRNDPITPVEPCGTGGLAVSGLAVNRSGFGTSAMTGALFFTDYTRGCVWYLPATGAGGRPNASSPTLFASDVGALVDLSFGPEGALYALEYAEGSLIRFDGGNSPAKPDASFTATPTSGTAPLTTQFDASGTTDPNPGDTLTYAWDMDGNGTTDRTGVTTNWTYNTNGSYTATLTVTDQTGRVDTASTSIFVGGNAPVVSMTEPAEGRKFKVGATVPLRATATAGGNALPDSAFQWDLVLNHCIAEACHTHGLTSRTGRNTSFVMPDHEYPSFVDVKLTVTAPNGQTTIVNRDAIYRTVDIDFTADPSGIEITVGSLPDNAPFTREVAMGATTSISVDPTQTIGGVARTFSNWTVDGAAGGNSQALELQPAVDTDVRSIFTTGGGGGGDATADCSVTLVNGDPRVSFTSENASSIIFLRDGNWQASRYNDLDAGTWTDPSAPDGARAYALRLRGTGIVGFEDVPCGTVTVGGGGGGGDATAECSVSLVGGDPRVVFTSDNASSINILRDGSWIRSFSGQPLDSNSHTDTGAADGVRAYALRLRGPGIAGAQDISCGSVTVGGGGGGGLAAPASCAVTVAGGNIEVTWPSAANAVDYIVRRNVDAGPDYWRGKTSSTSFTDSTRNNVTIQYKVSSKGADGAESSRTTCTPDLDL